MQVQAATQQERDDLLGRYREAYRMYDHLMDAGEYDALVQLALPDDRRLTLRSAMPCSCCIHSHAQLAKHGQHVDPPREAFQAAGQERL